MASFAAFAIRNLRTILFGILIALDEQAQNVPRKPDHALSRYPVRNWQLRTLRVHPHRRDFIAPLAITGGRMEYFYISADERLSL
jgi:hypothetical protein